MAIQRRMGLSKMGLEGQSSPVGTAKIDETKSSIDIFSPKMYELDEEPQVTNHNKMQESDNRMY